MLVDDMSKGKLLKLLGLKSTFFTKFESGLNYVIKSKKINE